MTMTFERCARSFTLVWCWQDELKRSHWRDGGGCRRGRNGGGLERNHIDNSSPSLACAAQ